MVRDTAWPSPTLTPARPHPLPKRSTPRETAIDLRLDVTDGAAIEAVACEIDKRWGGVQVLVNNAVLTRAVPVLDIALDDWDAVMAVNARGTFAASQIFARRMKAAGYGRIINMASLAGQNGAPPPARIMPPARVRSSR
jgi:3-oxoacyl-[acyl-carrier protein] reductase